MLKHFRLEFALEAATIVERNLEIKLKLVVDYQNLHKIMRLIKEHQLNIVHQKMDGDVEIQLHIRKSVFEKYRAIIADLHYLKYFSFT